MDPREVDSLVQRLVANPHDQDALAYAHQAGSIDPKSYATLLERVGRETPDPAYASHWLSEAANVWSTTLGDAHHAAEVLLLAVVKDPTQDVAAERLAQLYREKGDVKGLVALLEKRAKLLAPLAAHDGQVKAKLAAMHEELGSLWADAPLSQPTRAFDNFKRAYETDPQSVFAIYSARELLKQMQQYAEAVPLFAMEQEFISDPERKMALYRDEADVRRLANDLPGVTQALRNLRAYAPEEPGLIQEQATSVLERVRANESVPREDLQEGGALFVALAEMYDGEHGYSYSLAALDIEAGNDRAVQLATYYGEQLGRQAELLDPWKRYLAANPDGAMAPEIAGKLVAAGEQVPAPGSMASAPGLEPSAPDFAASESDFEPSARDFVASAPDFEPSARDFVASAPDFEPSARNFVASAPDFEPSARDFVASAPDFEPSPRAPSHAAASQPAAFEAGLPAESYGDRTEEEQGHPQVESTGAERISTLLEEASSLAAKRKTREALATYSEVLRHDPVSPEALAWVDEHLRAKRKFADLRDVYQAASRASSISQELRRKFLLNVASICEQQLRDLDGAIQALKQASQIDASVRDNLRRLLEKGQRWDDLAVLLDQEIMDAPDAESQITMLKKLAQLQEQKRKDLAAAGEAWGRVASLIPGDEHPIQIAVKLFERGERLDLAADVIAEGLHAIDVEESRAALLMKLGELREQVEDASGAGDAYVEAATSGVGIPGWIAAERCYSASERWEDAARAAGEWAGLTEEPRKQAELHAREASFLFRAEDPSSALLRLEQAADLDPETDGYAASLEQRYLEADRIEDLIAFLLRRAGKLVDKARRVALRHRAAEMQRERLSDLDGARESLQLLLEDGEDVEALRLLAEDARGRSDFADEASLLHRLAAITDDPAARKGIMLREAAVLATDLEDLDGAVEAYQVVLSELDPNNVTGLQAIVDLEERRHNAEGAVAALEKLLGIDLEVEQKVEIGRRLADLYENRLQDTRGAIHALEAVYAADEEDLNAVSRLVELCEGVEDWKRTAELLAVLLEFEGDPEEASDLARRLAAILHERLDQGQEALAALEVLADQGDERCRDAYISIGDTLGFKGIVAMKLRDWHALSSGEKQHEAFRGAFYRFREMGRDADAAQLAVELIRARGATEEIIKELEEIAIRTKDVDSLSAAHDVMVRELSGEERAQEFVRQAEVLIRAGVDPAEAVQHGEQGLTSVAPGEVEELLESLSKLVGTTDAIIDLYERQVGRCRNPQDKLQALARAAQAAAAHGSIVRARALFDLALGGGVRDETLEVLEEAAQAGDQLRGSTELRNALAVALASGSHGARDGGRTRSSLLRRAALIAHRDLGDVDRAFQWLGEALVTHVEADVLDALEDLGEEVGDVKRVEATLGKALEQVFDGPLVRQVVARRAKLRSERLNDKSGAAEDLKKLHDLSPQDKSVTDELHALLTELRDWRSLVQLLEDQILRGKDPNVRADLARQAARLWEERLADPRESADAWRRVLRMRPGDSEAQEGLDRSKSNMLKKPLSQMPPDLDVLVAPPSTASEGEPPVVDNDHEDASPTMPPPPRDQAASSDPTAGVADVASAPAQPAAPSSQEEDAGSAEPGELAAPVAPDDLHDRASQVAVSPQIPSADSGDGAPSATVPPVSDAPVGASEQLSESAAGAREQSRPEFVPEDLIESLDEEVDQMTDEELLMEPAEPVYGGTAGSKS